MTLALGAFSMAEKCLLNANDLHSLFLLYSCSGNAESMARIAHAAQEKGLFHLAFNAYM